MSNTIVVVVKGLIISNGKMLLLKRSDSDDIDPGGWEVVGGKIEFDEELEHALIREIKEEAGIEARVERILYATTFKTNPSRQVIILTYLCSTEQENITLSDEHNDYLWADKQQVRKIILPAILTDFHKHNIFELQELQ